MSKLANIIRQYNEQGKTFASADASVEDSFNNRERFEDDELDNISLRCAYLDGIARAGWTQVDYEYVFSRMDDTFNEVQYLKETADGYVNRTECGESEHPRAPEEAGEGRHGQCDDAGCLGNPEAGGGSVGSGQGFTGSVDLFDAQPCTGSGADDSEYVAQRNDSCCQADR